MVQVVTPLMMLDSGLAFLGYQMNERSSEETWIRRFRAHYGSKPVVYSRIFADLQTTPIAEARVEGNKINSDKIMVSVRKQGFNCEILEDKICTQTEKL